MKKHFVPAGVPDTPVAKYLQRAYPALPGWALRDALKRRDVRVNGEKCDAARTVRAGDELTLYLDDKYLTGALPVLYEDEGLLAVEKTAGLPVDADGENVGEDTALRRARAYCPAARLCHRLDTGTGGVLLLAKTDEAEAIMRTAFAGHDLRKFYHCLVAGVPSPERAELRAYLAKDAEAARVRVFDAPRPGAKPIETRYRLLKTDGSASLLEVEIVTGRTHQIRAHLAHAGLPILGDDKYGDRERNASRRHPALWCVRIEWNGLRIESNAPFSL